MHRHEVGWIRRWAALALLASACGTPAEAQSPGTTHGAAPMDAQQQRLAPLMNGDVTATPAGVDPVIWKASIPVGNEMTAARVALGRALYFDTRLSADGTVSCATCHDVTRSFTDLRPVSEGIKDQLGQRNAPTTMNAALLEAQFWDARATTVDEQAKMPIVNPIEMGMKSGDDAVEAIAGDATYVKMFQDAYGEAPSYDGIGRAIGAFERTLIFLDAPLERFLAGDQSAMSDSAKRGWALYNGKGRCVTCHPVNRSNPTGSDNRFHNVGVSARHRNFEALAVKALEELKKDPSLENIDNLAVASDLSELGRFLISKNYSEIGAFRTPQLRNVGITGPYMHDGSMQTLWDVMDHYNKGGEANPYLDGGMEPLALSEPEIDDVVALLFALTDARFADQNRAEMERQRKQADSKRPFRDNELAHRKKLAFDPRKQGSAK